MQLSTEVTKADARLHSALRRIIHAYDTGSREVMSEFGITGTQLSCLAAVAAKDDTTARAVAREIHVGASTLVGVLDRLEAKGLVARLRDVGDRRRILLRATPAGKRLLRRAPSPLGRTLHGQFMRLPDKEQQRLASAAAQIADLLESG